MAHSGLEPATSGFRPSAFQTELRRHSAEMLYITQCYTSLHKHAMVASCLQHVTFIKTENIAVDEVERIVSSG